MDKEALSYGFKAYPDRETAVELIPDSNDFAAQYALSQLENTDYDYGFSYKNRKALNKLNKIGLKDAIKSSPGFIEEYPGHTKVPDIYATPEGAARASEFIRYEILPKYDSLNSDLNSAIKQELQYTKKINESRESYNEKKQKLQNQIADSVLDFQTTRDADLFNRIRGRASQLRGKIDEAKLSLNESLYRHAIDRYKKKISDVPDSVMYSRFADAIDNSLADDNELYSFRYY